MDIPPQFQLLTALVIGVLVAVGAAYRFFADLRKPQADERSDLRLLGAALGDSAALDRITAELRTIAERESPEAEAIVRALNGLARALNHLAKELHQRDAR